MHQNCSEMLEKLPLKSTKFNPNVSFFESLRMRVETENESSHNKIESQDWEWDESFPWESQFRDQDESLAEA